MVQDCYTVKQVAEILKLGEDAVLALIARGDLPASNVNTKADAQRPRWRISDADLCRFLLRTRHEVARRPQRNKATTRAAKDYFA